MPKSRGRNAGDAGRYNEDSFTSYLDLAGLPYQTQVKFMHPWKKDGRADVLIMTTPRILVQNKNQNVSGTCDEKIPFQFDIARWSHAELVFGEFWLVLGGRYWSTEGGQLRVNAYCMKAKEFEALMMNRVTAKVLLQPSKSLTLEINKLR